jgi:large subunit ribosomal protein L24e
MTFVRNDCKVFKFCRAKCHKHFKAKHNPRKLAWTKAYRKLHGKEMTNDSIFEFEKKRNEPVQYNRDMYVKTIQAMKKIADIRDRREERFWQNRMKLASVQKVAGMNKEVEIHCDLISNKELKETIQENVREKLR